MSPAHEIAQYLAGQGVGTFGGDAGWSIGVARMPDKPDEAICLYDAPGGSVLEYEIELHEVMVELRIRGTDYEAVQSKFREIEELLTQPGDVVPDAIEIEDGMYIGIWLDADMADIGRGDNDRFRVSGTYRCNRQPLEAIS